MSNGNPKSSEGKPQVSGGEFNSSTGEIMSRLRSNRTHTPPPQLSRSNFRIGSNRPPQPKPTTPVDSLDIVKKRYEELRKELSTVVAPELGTPPPVVFALNEGATLIKDTKTSESYGRALTELNKGLTFKTSVKDFNVQRNRASDFLLENRRLSQIDHNAVKEKNFAFKTAVEQIEQEFLKSATPSQVSTCAELMKNANDTLGANVAIINTSIEESLKVLNDADLLLGRWMEMEFIDLTEPMKKFNLCQRAFWLSTTAEDAKKSVEPLLNFKKDMEQVEKSASDAISSYKKYLEQRQKFMDVVHNVSILRGADSDPQMKQWIADAKSLAVQADELARSSKNSEGIKKATQLLSDTKTLVSQCETRSKQLKENANRDLEAIPKYQMLYSELRSVRASIAILPGATVVLKQADDLLTLYKITTTGEPVRGYADAVKALTGKPSELLELAKKASEEFLTRELPNDLKLMLESVNQKLMMFEKYVPAYRIDGQKFEIAAAVSEPDRAEAMKKLIAIGNRMDEERRNAESLRGKCQEKLKEAHLLIQGMKNTLPKESYQPFENRIEKTILPSMRDREFQSASSQLDFVIEKSKQAKIDFEQFAKEWEVAKKGLGECITYSQLAFSWGPMAGLALDLYQTSKAIISETDKSHNYADGIKRAKEISSRLQRLRDELMKAGIDDPTKLADYGKKRKELNDQFEKEKTLVANLLLQIENRLINLKLTTPKSTPAHTLFNKACEEWGTAYFSPKVESQIGPIDDLKKQYDISTKDFVAVKKLCEEALADPSVFDGLANEVKKEDLRLKSDKFLDDIQRMLNEMESLKIDTSAYRSSIANQPPKEASIENLKFLGETFQKVKEHYLRVQQESTQSCMLKVKEAEQMKKGLLKLKHEFYQFEDYFKEIEYQLLDLQAMFQSPDLALRANAEQQLDLLRQSLSESSQKDKNGITFAAVVNQWKTIIAKIGKDDLLKERMSVTHGVLGDEIQQIMIKAKSIPPKEALELLAKFEIKVDRAYEAALVQHELYKKFKLKLEGLNLTGPLPPTQWAQTDKITEVKKHTSTRVTDNQSHYWDSMETKLEKAKTLAKTEGQMANAFIELDKIEKELDAFLKLSPDQARELLQQKDSEESQKQRTLRDMIRQWESDSNGFLDKVLPTVEKEMKKNKNADLNQLDNLKKSVEFQSKILEPYLFILSKLPHRSLSSNKAPDMDEAIKAFADANRQLDQFRKTAERLAKNAEGTNVSYESDLKKIRQDWSDRVSRMQDAIKSFATSIEVVPSEIGTNPDDPNTYLKEDPAKELRSSAVKLAKSLDKLSKRIRPDAFDESINVIADKASPKEQKLKAREEALRQMRLLKAELVENPLVKGIFNTPNNPFNDVRGEIGLVRAGLRKVEIAILVSVDA